MTKRRGVLSLLTSLAALTYLDRMCMGQLGPAIQRALHLSAGDWGYVTGAFTLGYGGLEIPSGAWGDRFGQRRVLARIVLWWSLFTVLTGTVSHWALPGWDLWIVGGNLGLLALIVIRFLFGAGEAGAFPNISGSAATWFPEAERGRVQGLIWGASRVGAALTPWLIYAILEACKASHTTIDSWRIPFWLFGSLGVVWVVVWLSYYHDDPADQPGITDGELHEITRGRGRIARHSRFPWQLFAAPRLWLIMGMWACYTWGSTFYLYWLPTYLVNGRHYSDEQSHQYAPLVYIMGAIANPLGGIVSDRLSNRYGLKVGRRLVGSGSLAASAVILLLASRAEDRWLNFGLLMLGFGALDFMLATAWAVCMDVGGRHSGAVSGAMNSFGHIGSTACSILYGVLVERSGNDYDRPVILIVGMLLLSAVLFALIDPSRPLLRDGDEPVAVPD